jgi:hypothetical protein
MTPPSGRRRVLDMASAIIHDNQAASAEHSETAGPSADGSARLRLDPALPGQLGISGGWWPRSRDAGAELPAMLTELSAQAGRVRRVALQMDAFSDIPHLIMINGRPVHVAWFRSMDPMTINMTMAARDNLTLLVVPPGASADTAAEALRLAAASSGTERPEEILASAGITSDVPARSQPASLTG